MSYLLAFLPFIYYDLLRAIAKSRLGDRLNPKPTFSDCSRSDFGKSSAKRACGGELGNWIDVRHADGKVVRYGHLQQNSIKVKPGMSVSKGQVIAGVGSSGWSTGPHLDLRIHDGKGNYENPDKYIRR